MNLENTNLFGNLLEENNFDLIKDIQVKATIELGSKKIFLKDVLNLAPGAVLELDRYQQEPVDLLINGKIIAKGEVVVVDDCFGFKVRELVKQ
ncbi:MAG: flagellar motor switch protein FliN [Candidatus Margulisiibacteriota bacterium]